MSRDEDNVSYGSLCKKWGKRQTWTSKQFLCLLSGADPDDPRKERAEKGSLLEEIDPREYKNRFQILCSYIGTQSLCPINPTVPAEEQAFHKTDLVAVAVSQGWDVPKDLDAAVSTFERLLAQQPSTTRSRRHETLHEFVEDIYTRGARAGINWARSRDPLPITRGDLLELFLRQHAEIARVSKATFTDDLKAVRAKCAPGTRDDPKNPVARLFL